MDNVNQWNPNQYPAGVGGSVPYPSMQGSVLGGAPTPPALAESPSKIRDGVSHAEQLLSDIHECINMLEKRLDTVLTPQPPSAQSDGRNQPVPLASHLLGRIGIVNEGFTAATIRLRQLASRIEV